MLLHHVSLGVAFRWVAGTRPHDKQSQRNGYFLVGVGDSLVSSTVLLRQLQDDVRAAERLQLVREVHPVEVLSCFCGGRHASRHHGPPNFLSAHLASCAALNHDGVQRVEHLKPGPEVHQECSVSLLDHVPFDCVLPSLLSLLVLASKRLLNYLHVFR